MMTTSNHIPYLLLADDDPDDRSLFTETFRHQNPGYPVEEVNGGMAAVEYLKEAVVLPVVLVLDYQMPDLSGPEVLRRLAVNDRYMHMVKIMWSNSHPDMKIEECKRLGADHYIRKPANAIELNIIMRQVRDIFDSAAMEKA